MPEKRTKADTPDRGRSSVRRKTEAVLHLLRGEDLDTLSRERGVTAAILSSWREGFLDGAEEIAGVKLLRCNRRMALRFPQATA